MKTFPLEIYAIDHQSYCGPCEMLVLPAMDGEFGVMADHEPICIALKAGELRYTVGGETTILAVGDGFVEITESDVFVFADFAERADEIDMIRARNAAQRAEERIRAKKDARTVAHAEAALARAIARMSVVSHHRSR
jgi:F-type H+-transporting ATPase subunit epsilon